MKRGACDAVENVGGAIESVRAVSPPGTTGVRTDRNALGTTGVRTDRHASGTTGNADGRARARHRRKCGRRRASSRSPNQRLPGRHNCHQTAPGFDRRISSQGKVEGRRDPSASRVIVPQQRQQHDRLERHRRDCCGCQADQANSRIAADRSSLVRKRTPDAERQRLGWQDRRGISGCHPPHCELSMSNTTRVGVSR